MYSVVFQKRKNSERKRSSGADFKMAYRTLVIIVIVKPKFTLISMMLYKGFMSRSMTLYVFIGMYSRKEYGKQYY